MNEQVFHMIILGRTIEHLGSQMYKHRAPSIAELVANSWDAGATKVWIKIPDAENYNSSNSVFSIMDNGDGMDTNTIQHCYLVVGRNRRTEDGDASHGRRIMGRKGIGKLAGFGLAEKVTITTWTCNNPKAVTFSMTLDELKCDARESKAIQFPWHEIDKSSDWPQSGTLIELSILRHTSPIDLQILTETLARRFSRTTRGEMEISINNIPLTEPEIEMMYRYPKEGEPEKQILPSGQEIRFCYGFAKNTIRSKEMQGFVIYANERTAQAPPFFFNIESTASAQHSTHYVTGEIFADYLDSGTDDKSDVISTDRQELDWEKEELLALREWGEEFTRDILRKCAEMRGQQLENWILSNQEFNKRIQLLDPINKKEISRFLKVLGQKSEADNRAFELADALIRAYEFRTFHDVIDEIQKAGDDPEKLEEILGRLYDWKVLESRAILEIVSGRLSIINKLEQMIIANAPETASSITYDNLHDLLAEYPWLFNPDWQVFIEEKTIGTQLRQWGEEDCSEDIKNKRVDFLAFAKDTDELIIIELKRPGHAVNFDEIQRLGKYQVELMKSRPNCRQVLVYGGTVNIPENKWSEIKNSKDFEALEWSAMFARAKRFYSHYQAVLEGDISGEGFQSKKIEVARTKQILETNSTHRSAEDRKRGVGNYDV